METTRCQFLLQDHKGLPSGGSDRRWDWCPQEAWALASCSIKAQAEWRHGAERIQTSKETEWNQPQDPLHFWDATIGLVPALFGYANRSMAYVSLEVREALLLAIQTTNQSIRTNPNAYLELYFWSYWLISSFVRQLFGVRLVQAKHELVGSGHVRLT